MGLLQSTARRWSEDISKTLRIDDYNTFDEVDNINDSVTRVFDEMQYNLLIDEWDMGASSVFPKIEFIDEPTVFQVAKRSERYQITDGEMEEEVIFRMQPIDRNKVKIKIKSIRDAIPNFIEDDFK